MYSGIKVHQLHASYKATEAHQEVAKCILKTTLPSSHAPQSLCTAEHHLYTFCHPRDKYLQLQMSQGIIFSQKLA